MNLVADIVLSIVLILALAAGLIRWLYLKGTEVTAAQRAARRHA